MTTLYPLKFQPILKDKIWGGSRLLSLLNKDYRPLPNAGESWELSTVGADVSVCVNGPLAGNTLQELIEIYMGDLVGEPVYEEFGLEFPLLIKFIDANDNLSIQVHPDDEMAMDRHNSYGKTEMWYVVAADEGASLISGFSMEVDRDSYVEHLENGTLESVLCSEKVAPGDVFFIPAGRIHAIGAGIVLAEIQQASDVTYRVFDYNRTDDKGNLRELHTDMALDALDYSVESSYKTQWQEQINGTAPIVSCRYFTTNMLSFGLPLHKDYHQLDSFVVYICVAGAFSIESDSFDSVEVSTGDTILLPADIDEVRLIPSAYCKVLEVYL